MIEKFGNPTDNQKDIMRYENKILREMYRRGHIQKFFNYPPPANDSEYTKEELEYVKNATRNISEGRRDFINTCNEELFRTFCEVVLRRGIYADVPTLKKIVKDYEAPILFLKYKFNRPRPYQLDESIVPKVQTLPNDPSYPSGHALYSFILADYFSTKYPDHERYFWESANNISLSRQQGGVHYPSDEFGAYLLYRLLKHYNYLGW